VPGWSTVRLHVSGASRFATQETVRRGLRGGRRWSMFGLHREGGACERLRRLAGVSFRGTGDGDARGAGGVGFGPASRVLPAAGGFWRLGKDFTAEHGRRAAEDHGGRAGAACGHRPSGPPGPGARPDPTISSDCSLQRSGDQIWMSPPDQSCMSFDNGGWVGSLRVGRDRGGELGDVDAVAASPDLGRVLDGRGSVARRVSTTRLQRSRRN